MTEHPLTALIQFFWIGGQRPAEEPAPVCGYDPGLAHAEGWTVSECEPRENGYPHVELQCLDATDAGGPVFSDDAGAWRHVVARARQGSALHLAALALVDPVERRVIECHCRPWRRTP